MKKRHLAMIISILSGMSSVKADPTLEGLRFSICGQYVLRGVLNCAQSQCFLNLDSHNRHQLKVQIDHTHQSFLKKHYDGEMIEIEVFLSKNLNVDGSPFHFNATRLVPKRVFESKSELLIEEAECL